MVSLWVQLGSHLCVIWLVFVCIIVSSKNGINMDRFAAMTQLLYPDTEGCMPGMLAHQHPLLYVLSLHLHTYLYIHTYSCIYLYVHTSIVIFLYICIITCIAACTSLITSGGHLGLPLCAICKPFVYQIVCLYLYALLCAGRILLTGICLQPVPSCGI